MGDGLEGGEGWIEGVFRSCCGIGGEGIVKLRVFRLR